MTADDEELAKFKRFQQDQAARARMSPEERKAHDDALQERVKLEARLRLLRMQADFAGIRNAFAVVAIIALILALLWAAS